MLSSQIQGHPIPPSAGPPLCALSLPWPLCLNPRPEAATSAALPGPSPARSALGCGSGSSAALSPLPEAKAWRSPLLRCTAHRASCCRQGRGFRRHRTANRRPSQSPRSFCRSSSPLLPTSPGQPCSPGQATGCSGWRGAEAGLACRGWPTLARRPPSHRRRRAPPPTQRRHPRTGGMCRQGPGPCRRLVESWWPLSGPPQRAWQGRRAAPGAARAWPLRRGGRRRGCCPAPQSRTFR
mmetsp:Transcript_12356/g.34698  ORF Transcript_12356/g.34698 Transcript_12356/m.34698 type:complete len:238 (+) Transcript_12356:86-799(+)